MIIRGSAPILLLLLLLAPALAADDDADLSLEAARAELARRGMVEGEACGFLDGPGGFFALSRVFLAKGDREVHEGLLKDERPVVRAMGLFCLSQTLRKKAVPILGRHIRDSGRFEFLPYG